MKKKKMLLKAKKKLKLALKEADKEADAILDGTIPSKKKKKNKKKADEVRVMMLSVKLLCSLSICDKSRIFKFTSNPFQWP